MFEKMENLNGKDFLKTLKSIDIDKGSLTNESVDWIFCNPETQHMLFWLCSYINENNVETAHESYEKELLQKKGNILSNDRYDNKVQELNDSHPGIFNITEAEITKLQVEVDREEHIGRTLDNLTSNYLTLDYKIQQQLSKLESGEMYTQAKRDASQADCLKQSKQIDKMHVDIESNMKIYSDILLNYHAIDKYFLSQMPLDFYKQEDENFRTFLNFWIEKEFNVDEAIRSIKKSGNQNNSDSFMPGKEFERIYINIQDSIMNRIKAECVNIEMESRIDYMENNVDQQIYESERRIKSIQLSSRINSLTEDFNRICATELQQAIERYTQNLINNILSNQAQTKLNKCRKMINKLKCLNCEVNRAFSQNCLFALLFKTEKRKIESTIKFLSSSHYYLTNQEKEIKEKFAAMDILETDYSNYMQIPVEEREKLISDFLAVITGDYKSKIITAKSALTLVQQQEINMEHLEYDLFTSQNNKHLDTIKKMQNKVKEIKEFIWAGPTMQPVIIPYSFIENMFELQANIEKSAIKINKCLHTYKGMEGTLSNKWCKDKKLLYVWFLTEPKKLLAAIQRLEDHLSGKTTPQIPLLVEI